MHLPQIQASHLFVFSRGGSSSLARLDRSHINTLYNLFVKYLAHDGIYSPDLGSAHIVSITDTPTSYMHHINANAGNFGRLLYTSLLSIVCTLYWLHSCTSASTVSYHLNVHDDSRLTAQSQNRFLPLYSAWFHLLYSETPKHT